MLCLHRRLEEPGPHGEDQLEAAASTRVDMRAGGVDAPYAHHRGEFRFRFSLVYASLEDVVPLVEELLLLAHAAAARGGTRAARAEAAQRLAQIIQVGADQRAVCVGQGLVLSRGAAGESSKYEERTWNTHQAHK